MNGSISFIINNLQQIPCILPPFPYTDNVDDDNDNSENGENDENGENSEIITNNNIYHFIIGKRNPTV